ncbi:MAG TPA: hypothetical protein VE713_08610, partial [Pyrinomonadaceae bacterium]|nr:hypothetical protein [Pyrinomonadaceae bacterium]
MKSETEIWQVMTGEEVYQADLQTLKQWIVEGLVQPTDMVRKGNLKWIEAGRAPGLRRVFTGEEQPPTFVQPDAHAAHDARPAHAALEPTPATAALESTHAPAASSHAHVPASASQTHTHGAASQEAEWPQTLAVDEGARSRESARASWGGS